MCYIPPSLARPRVHALVDCLGCPFVDARDSTAKVSCLKSLSLRHCNIRSASAEKFFAALAHNTVLERLNMSWNGIRQVGAPEIAKMLAEPRIALKELDLRDNQLGTQDALGQAFIQAFQVHEYSQAFITGIVTERMVNSSLRLLNLGNNELTANGMKLLVEAFPFFVALQELLLYHNPEIGVQGARAIARLLSMTDGEGLRSLRRLVVSVCGLSDAGIRAIAGVLRGNDRLTELDISGNSATDSSMQSLAEVVAANRTLEMLNISLNCIDQSGLGYLLDGAIARRDPDKATQKTLVAQVFEAAREPALMKIDVSAQAASSLIQMDTAGISHDVLDMFIGLPT